MATAVDRTSEFHLFCTQCRPATVSFSSDSTIGSQGPSPASTQFLNTAIDLLQHCNTLDDQLWTFVGISDALNRVLLGGYGVSNSTSTSWTSDIALKEIKTLRASIATLEQSLDNAQFSPGTEAHFRAIIAIFYKRLRASSQMFQQAESKRFQREARLRKLSPTNSAFNEKLGASNEENQILIMEDLHRPTPWFLPYLYGGWGGVFQQGRESKQESKAALFDLPPSRDSDSMPVTMPFHRLVEDTTQVPRPLMGCNVTSNVAETVGKGRHFPDLAEADARNPSKRIASSKLRHKISEPEDEPQIDDSLRHEINTDVRTILLDQVINSAEQAKLRQTYRNLAEVSQILTFFSTKVEEQNEVCEQVVHQMEESTGHVDQAAIELKKVHERKSSYRSMMIFIYLGAAFFLLLIDFLTSSKWY